MIVVAEAILEGIGALGLDLVGNGQGGVRAPGELPVRAVRPGVALGGERDVVVLVEAVFRAQPPVLGQDLAGAEPPPESPEDGIARLRHLDAARRPFTLQGKLRSAVPGAHGASQRGTACFGEAGVRLTAYLPLEAELEPARDPHARRGADLALEPTIRGSLHVSREEVR